MICSHAVDLRSMLDPDILYASELIITIFRDVVLHDVASPLFLALSNIDLSQLRSAVDLCGRREYFVNESVHSRRA